jgi:hypothetical protein
LTAIQTHDITQFQITQYYAKVSYSACLVKRETSSILHTAGMIVG